MADFIYNVAKKRLLDGDLHLDTDDLRIILLEAVVGEDKDHATMTAALAPAGLTELTSTGYVTVLDYANGSTALTEAANQQDDSNDRGEAHASDPSWASISQAAAETVVGAIIYIHVDGTGANDIPLAFIDSLTGFPLTPNGSNITLAFNAEGWLHLDDA